MRLPLPLIAALALVAFGLNQVGVLPAKAHAAPKWQATLAATDAGASNVACLDAGIGNAAVVVLQSTTGTEYCFKTCPTSTCAPDCTKDFRPNQSIYENSSPDSGLVGTTTEIQRERTTAPIAMGLDRCIVAKALDAGSPAVNLFLLTGQPIDPRPIGH